MAWDDQEYDDIYRRPSRLEVAGGSALRIALLFGSAAVAVALVVSQVLDNRMTGQIAQGDVSAGLDLMSTGSVGYNGTYTLRKSVLQPTPNSVCILRDNGTHSGDC